MKKSLIDTNPYLKDPARRLRILTRNAWESSVFEGAKLPKPDIQLSSSKPRARALAKNRVSAS